MKMKMICLLLALALVCPLIAQAGMIVGNGGTMFVYTENGKSLNVRSAPETGDNVIGHLKYGAKVEIARFLNNGWAQLQWDGGEAYVQSRFLQWYEPAAKPTPKPTEDPEKKKAEAQLKAELQSERSVQPYAAVARASRSSGWVNMRKQPSKSTARIEQCADGTELTVIGETLNWYKVLDPANGKTGYIRQDFITVVPVTPEPEPAAPETSRIGTLNVNGEFTLQCRIPEGYELQVISSRGARIIASLTAGEPLKPQMLLTVSYDDTYADVERMNDLTGEEMETIKESFTAMNEVSFEERETSHGSKLLIAKETGTDTDFVDIFSIYQGYTVEFVLSPNPEAADQTLTAEQIQMCIDFLSDLDFISAD